MIRRTMLEGSRGVAQFIYNRLRTAASVLLHLGQYDFLLMFKPTTFVTY